MFSLLLAVLGCATYPGACETYYKNWCESCDLSDYDKTVCKCLEEGEIDGGDFPEGYDVSDDDAAALCTYWAAEVSYPSDDASAQCRQVNAVFAKHEGDACDALGLNSD